jgi:formylglycine-generating enzyme required for sulfatase activity
MYFGMYVIFIVSCSLRKGYLYGPSNNAAETDGGGLSTESSQEIEASDSKDNVVEVVSEPYIKGYETVVIPSGDFMMGCTLEQGEDCDKDEFPVHYVIISHDFHMMKSEITQELYQKVMFENPSRFTDCGGNCPVEMVSWYDAVQFANNLSRQEELEVCYIIDGIDVKWTNGVECTGWRLPTEAEWEYASRGLQSFKFSGGDSVHEVAWYSKNSYLSTHNVCTKNKNGYGLCDMSGNVWEWVYDKYNTYAVGPVVDPISDSGNEYRVLRGGNWYYDSFFLRSTKRHIGKPSFSFINIGFRLVRTIEQE